MATEVTVLNSKQKANLEKSIGIRTTTENQIRQTATNGNRN